MSAEEYLPRWGSHPSAAAYLCEYAAWRSAQQQLGDKWSGVLGELLAVHAARSNRHVGALYDWTRLNLRQIEARRDGQGRFGHGGQDAKPRIDVDIGLTAPGNLSVRWRPTGLDVCPWRAMGAYDLTRGDAPRTDFVFFDAYERPGERPAHELLFLRGAAGVGVSGAHGKAEQALDVGAELLMCSIRATVEELLARLRDTFSVTVLNNLELELIDGRAVVWHRC